MFVYCGDDLARCPFAKGGAVPEGLPVLTVDEEIYRLTPAFVIATVDKFARLAREGEPASLFGYRQSALRPPRLRAPRLRRLQHHHRHPGERTPPGGHRASGRPAAAAGPDHPGRAAPDHRGAGHRGRLVRGRGRDPCLLGAPDGKPVRPLIVASTATVRNAEEQVRGLYGRRVEMFPPQVLDVADTYFSREMPITPTDSGPPLHRRQRPGCAAVQRRDPGRRGAAVGRAVAVRPGGIAADPYMTLVGYFNATRELAGMARYMADDVQSRVKRPRKDSGFPRRLGAAFGLLNIGELTVPDRLGRDRSDAGPPRAGVRPVYDTTEAFTRSGSPAEGRQEGAARKEMPFDVVLATSMLQVGVDVQRLGLMLVVGQPKNTAEYIQASSRVGRDAERPGLVVALGNWARPRDLAHFEQFRHYHETFYAQVEALSVTPYSPTSLARGHRRAARQRRAGDAGASLAEGCHRSAMPGGSRISALPVEAHGRAAQGANRGGSPERRRGQAGQRSAGQPDRPVDRAGQARRRDE